mmetsp:Transcript_16194/g.49198  ORF Transcript_16194/g.49198 Transcript_16194/m.49198 type:complete len:83 (+) Transcript_16194:574-822(+)|eukprot:scaffold300309_cov36-Tisochrysis_lutea.AAC.1
MLGSQAQSEVMPVLPVFLGGLSLCSLNHDAARVARHGDSSHGNEVQHDLIYDVGVTFPVAGCGKSCVGVAVVCVVCGAILNL